VPRAVYPQARASSPRTPARPHLRCGLLDLASGGVCQAIPITRNAGALLPHRFTLTTARVAVCFLWHFPASRLGLLLAITLLCEVRTFLDSSPVNRHAPRPPGQLVRVEHGTRCGIPKPTARPASSCGHDCPDRYPPPGTNARADGYTRLITQVERIGYGFKNRRSPHSNALRRLGNWTHDGPFGPD
jgi:hypothetical protein